jgi:hypothetical protein
MMYLSIHIMLITHLRWIAAAIVAVAPVHAQLVAPSRACAAGAVTTTLPGGLRDEIVRAQTIRSRGAWSLNRGATDAARSRMLADSSPQTVRVAAVLPEILATSQQSFPLPANDGPLWAGKGLSYSITGGLALCGAHAKWGAIIAPTYWYAENAPFELPDNPQFVPPIRQDYSPWASPYHYIPRSLDSPRRFGDNVLKRVDPGAIALWFRTPRFEAGFTTESEWWGPGLHNALLLSSQAAGAPRAYVRTSAPIKAAGELDLRYFIGGVSFSPFFFAVPEDSTRSLSGVSAVWRPNFERGLTLGVARIVAAPRFGNNWFKHLLDPVVPVGTPNALPYSDKTQYPGRDQLFSLFADWRLPDDGSEIWFEWGRAEIPNGLRDFIESPNHTQALTLGLQHVRPLRWNGWSARVGAEYTQTNQSSTFRERPTGSWYTSRAVQGGFTQKGQVLGAVVGPGSVTQRVGLDFLSPTRSIGIFAYRVKWDEDAFYTIPRPNGNGLCKHDVSLAVGARGSARTPAGWFEATVTTQNRLNLYWQALGLCFDNEELQIDKRNLSIEFRFHPSLRPKAKPAAARP